MPRKAKDWDSLFIEWVKSGKPKAAFLLEKGIKTSGGVSKATADWTAKFKAMANGMRETSVLSKAEVPAEAALPAEPTAGRTATDVAVRAQPSPWQTVQEWRRKQSIEDYKSGDTVRTAVKLLLKNSMKRVDVGDGKVEFQTTLKPHEVKQLAQALESVQRIQRLAVGLSTENIGIDTPGPAPGDTHVEKNVTPEADIPTFVVEMRGGRFVRPRPRRIS